MAKKKHQPKGVFCLEADWWGVKDKTSVEHLLRLLESIGSYTVPYVHHDVGTREEFNFYLDKWKRSFTSYPILYLGFHGDSGGITVGEGRNNHVPLSDLAERLEGSCRGRVIHFGSCGTLDVHGHRLNAFLKRTGALAVCGYQETVDWIESAAFDLLVLGGLQGVSFRRTSSMEKFADELRKVTAPGLARNLGFRMQVHPE
jgi:hypothetical protein